MEVTYLVESADVKAFMRHHRRVSSAYRRIYVVVSLMAVALSLQSALNQTGSVGFRVAYFFVSVILILLTFMAASFLLNQVVMFRAFRGGDQYGLLGAHTLTITPEGLRERTKANDSKTFWSGIYQIDSTKDHIFIFTQPNMAHPIPRRAFNSPEEAAQFLTTALQYHEAAKSNSSP